MQTGFSLRFQAGKGNLTFTSLGFPKIFVPLHLKYKIFGLSMKKILTLLLLLVACSASLWADDEPATYSNPIIGRSLPDPTVIRARDGMFYLYATEDIHNTPIYRSADLVHWDFVGTCFTDATRPKMVPGGGIWAPDINYINGKYVLYYSKSTWGGEWECGIGVATSDYPEGPFTDVGKLFISSEIGVQNSIDPFYIEDEGTKYLFWGSFRDIYAIELSDDGLSVKEGAQKVKISGGRTEGTYIIKHDGYFYLIGSAGSCCEGAKSTYNVLVARSKNILGPYVNRNGQKAINDGFSQLLAKSADVIGPGHNAEFIEDDNGTFYIIYHGYEASDPDGGRKVFMDPIIWDRSGWPTVRNMRPSKTALAPVFRHDVEGERTIGNPVPLGDPYILNDGDMYYAYGTHDEKGIEVYRSQDLTNWVFCGLAIDTIGSRASGGFRAPEVHKTGSQYILYYTADNHIFAATGPTPIGPFTEQESHLLHSVLASEAYFDGTRFTDSDGQHYLFYVRHRDGSDQLWMCGLEEDGLTPIRPTRNVSAPSQAWEKEKGSVNCAPFVVKKDDRYFITYTGNAETSLRCGIGYLYSSYPARSWRKYSYNPIWQGPEELELTSTAHASFFYDADSTLLCVYDAFNSNDTINPKLMYISPAVIEEGVLSIRTDSIIRPFVSGDESAGIRVISAENYRIFPRRTSGSLRIENPAGKPFEWEVVSLHGKVMKTGKATGSALVSLADVPQGLYIVHVTGPDGEYSEKVLRV